MTTVDLTSSVQHDLPGLAPGDPGYDAATLPWAAAVVQRPARVATPRDAAEVAVVVRAAARAGLRVAPQGTGHNAGPLGALDDTLLLRTSAMTDVRIDPDRRIARAEAGAVWEHVTVPAGAHGLAALHGSSPDVGVVGYSLGGGLGWYARSLGLQTNALTAAELVLADGSQVRVDADHDAELFWALRGGGGNLGVVTALEFRLFPIATAHAGMLVWDWSAAETVLPRWLSWARHADESVTSAFRILQLPPFPQIPEPVRGRQLVVIDGAVLGDDESAGALLAPLRALGPEIDTFATVPAASLVRLHMDPEGPTPGVTGTALLSVPESDDRRLVDAVLDAAGPGSGTSLLVAAELRQLGGALGRPHPAGGAVSMLPGDFLAFACGIAPGPEAAALAERDTKRVVGGLSPWRTGRDYLNFVEESADPARGYDAGSYARLAGIRARVDPDGLIRANHEIPVPGRAGS